VRPVLERDHVFCAAMVRDLRACLADITHREQKKTGARLPGQVKFLLAEWGWERLNPPSRPIGSSGCDRSAMTLSVVTSVSISSKKPAR
jgi:hypothetical protein